MRYCLPRLVLLQLYHALIEPYLMYCNIVWAAHQSTVLKQLFISQKKAIRLITFSPWQSHTKQLFIKLELLTVYNINSLQLGCFMYSAVHSLLPAYFKCMFITNTTVHSYNTRQKDDMHQTAYRTNVCKYTVRILGPRLWNSLSDNIRQVSSLYQFKSKMKEFLLGCM